MILCVLIYMLFNTSGAQDVQTVSQVSVQERRSIVIPCWYNCAYVNNVKYLSFGDHWTFSKYIEFSDGREKHETVSVSDNKSASIVSIDMRNIQQSQSGTYWCAIDGPRSHIQNGFNLKVTAGIAGLYVQDQMLAGFEGGSVTVACYYHLPRKTGIKWCKLAGNCVLEPGGLLDGASVEIRNSNGVVSVSVSRLKKENTGWYWCSVRELQMPVHITVSTREETSASTPETTSSQPPTTSSVKSTGSFTSAQMPRSRERRLLLWLIIVLVFSVILSCGAVLVITLCKTKRVLPRSTSLRNLRSHTENTYAEITCEGPLAQAALRDDEVIYSTVSPGYLYQTDSSLDSSLD